MRDSLLRRVRSSLKYRIAAIIFLLEAVMMAAVLGVTLSYSRHETEKHLAANEQVMMQLLADLSRVALFTAEYDDLQPYMEEVVRDPRVSTVLLADRRGRVVVSSEHGAIGKPMPDLESDPARRWLSREITSGGRPIGVLAMRFSHEDLQRINREVWNLGVSIALMGMMLIAVVGILIGHLLTRRLEALSGAAQRLAGGDLTVRTRLAGQDEVAIVGQAFDTMAQSVRTNVEALKHATDLLEHRVADRTRELAEARDQAVGANRSKSAFLANMSHEIRTPLTAIIGFSETLLDPNQPMTERVDSIRTIIRGGKHLLNIINDILDVSKIEAGRLEIEQIAVNPFEVLDDVQAIVALLADEKRLAFEAEYAFPLPTQIVSDPLRLKQILINLCNNAIKFTNRGSVHIKMTCMPESQRLVFEVTDTGIGMTAAQIDSVFRPFTQADTSITREFGGTGLGLYLSRQLAERLGGTISVESEPGSGSRFTLTIHTGPIDRDRLVSQWVRSAPPAETIVGDIALAGDVLVVEDNTDNQKLVTFLLRRVGATVAIADNGLEAVEMALARNRPYDLILMDMQMPVLGGIDATRLLREREYRAPIVALTANALKKEDIGAFLEAGCDDFIAKPIHRERLYELLTRYLRSPDGGSSGASDPLSSTLLREEPELKDLFIAFVDRLPAVVGEIREAFAQRDFRLLKNRIHTLKGSAGNFGYPDLFRLCQILEFELAKENESGIAALLSNVDKLVARIELGMRQHLHTVPGGSATG
ncbi:MAG: ATP-binding protein [Gammaproteobacteria bacterium]|nr:ATP-binding protein [Gammaproteobacteria bacterium]